MPEDRHQLLKKKDQGGEKQHQEESVSNGNQAPQLHIQPSAAVEERSETEVDGTPLGIDDLIGRKGKDREDDDDQQEPLPDPGVSYPPCLDGDFHDEGGDDGVRKGLNDIGTGIGIEEG